MTCIGFMILIYTFQLAPSTTLFPYTTLFRSFVLKYLLGYPDVRNYDGSWTEWGNLVRTPIEKPLTVKDALGSVDVLPVHEPGEDNLRLFDRINAAVVPHPQTPGIRRPGQETN